MVEHFKLRFQPVQRPLSEDKNFDTKPSRHLEIALPLNHLFFVVLISCSDIDEILNLFKLTVLCQDAYKISFVVAKTLFAHSKFRNKM